MQTGLFAPHDALVESGGLARTACDGGKAAAISAASRKAAEVMQRAAPSPACSETRPMAQGAAALTTRPML